MGIIFNLQNSNLLTLSLPIEEVQKKPRMVTKNVSNQENFTTLTNNNVKKMRDQPVGLIFLPPT